MREIRQSGSEGGGAGYSTGPPYPYFKFRPSGAREGTSPSPTFLSEKEGLYGPKLQRSSTRTASFPVLKRPSALMMTLTQAWAWVESLCQRSSIIQPKGCATGRAALPTWTFWVVSGKALLLPTSRGFSSSSKITSCISPSGDQLGAAPQEEVATAARRLSRQTTRSVPPEKVPPST